MAARPSSSSSASSTRWTRRGPRARRRSLRDGRFACVGSRRVRLARARRGPVRIEVGSAVPGLVDAHGHVIGLGRAGSEVSCAGLGSEDACAARAAERARALPAGSWIRGRGWDQNRWPRQAFPSEATLSRAVAGPPRGPRARGRPRGMGERRARSPPPASGRERGPAGRGILRDAGGRADGRARGRRHGARADARSPRRRRRRSRGAPSPASPRSLALGLTAAHDAGVTPERARRRTAGSRRADRLPLRVYAMIDGAGRRSRSVVAQIARWRPPPRWGGSRCAR